MARKTELWPEWMPEHRPPWECPVNARGAGVAAPRAAYAAGFWSYAVGRRAPEAGLRRYRAACRAAEAAGWNPWWIRSVADVAAVEAGCWMDEGRGWRVVGFFERLLAHTNGRWAGKPFALMDWQVYDVVMPLFGWMRPCGPTRTEAEEKEGRHGQTRTDTDTHGREEEGRGHAGTGADTHGGRGEGRGRAGTHTDRHGRARTGADGAGVARTVVDGAGGERPVRRFRKAAVWTPKKNGKSGLASGLGLYLLCGDGEAGAEVYCAASARRQAAIVHREAQRMARRSPGLKGRVQVIESSSRIRFPLNDGIFEAISSEAGVQEGLNWSGLIFDELHVADRKLVETVDEGGIARAQSLMVAISTAGVYDPNAVGWEWWERTRGVQEGAVRDTGFFAVCYAAPDGADPSKPETWRRANPSLGLILDEEQLRETWEGNRGSAAAVAKLRRYRLNQWVKASHGWIEPRLWARLGTRTGTDKHGPTRTGAGDPRGMARLAGRVCYGGLDLSSVVDLSAFGLWFPAPDGRGPAEWRCWFWLPEENIEERERESGAPYREWAAQGWITLTPGDVIDHAVIRQQVEALAAAHDLREIAFDPWQATQLVSELQDEGGIEMFRYSQAGATMSPALREAERVIRKGLVRHDANPVMDWMMASAEIHTDHNGNIRLVKGDRKARRKIDGVVALVMALDRAARNAAEGAAGRSRWEEEGAAAVVVG